MNISFVSPVDDRLILSNREGLIRRARTLVGPADAEDVVHDAFERALRSRSVRTDRDPRPWLYRIARNAGLDALRARTREIVVDPLAGPDPFAGADEAESAERIALRRETALELDFALQSLPEVQRRTLVLHDLEGYSNHEIAALDGVSYQTVRTRLFRARRAMRGVLQPVAA